MNDVYGLSESLVFNDDQIQELHSTTSVIVTSLSAVLMKAPLGKGPAGEIQMQDNVRQGVSSYRWTVTLCG